MDKRTKISREGKGFDVKIIPPRSHYFVTEIKLHFSPEELRQLIQEASELLGDEVAEDYIVRG